MSVRALIDLSTLASALTPKEEPPKEEPTELIFSHGPMEAGELVIYGKDNVEYLRFKNNGDIYVRGKLVENDKEVVAGMRALLNAPEPLPPGGGRIRFERILEQD